MNILIFGPNGSGKGTQGAIVQKKFGVPHIERASHPPEHQGGNGAGMKAKASSTRRMVPDAITGPMIPEPLDRDELQETGSWTVSEKPGPGRGPSGRP